MIRQFHGKKRFTSWICWTIFCNSHGCVRHWQSKSFTEHFPQKSWRLCLIACLDFFFKLFIISFLGFVWFLAIAPTHPFLFFSEELCKVRTFAKSSHPKNQAHAVRSMLWVIWTCREKNEKVSRNEHTCRLAFSPHIPKSYHPLTTCEYNQLKFDTLCQFTGASLPGSLCELLLTSKKMHINSFQVKSIKDNAFRSLCRSNVVQMSYLSRMS